MAFIDPFSIIARPSYSREEHRDMFFEEGFQGFHSYNTGWRYYLAKGVWTLQLEQNTRFTVTAKLDANGVTKTIGEVTKAGTLLKIPVPTDSYLWFQLGTAAVNENDIKNTSVYGFAVHMPEQAEQAEQAE